MVKPKIINVLYHTPPYDLYKDNRPEVHWRIAPGEGGWVGIWGTDWPDILGNEILKVTDQLDYEVWQPDLRALTEYRHRFPSGLVHTLFPARLVSFQHGSKVKKQPLSQAIVDAIHREAKLGPVILHLNSDPIVPLNKQIIEACAHLPIMITFHGVFQTPGEQIFRVRKNVGATFSFVKQDRSLRRSIMPAVDAVTYQNDIQRDYLHRYYDGYTQRLTMGCDFRLWGPGVRMTAKLDWDIDSEPFVISMAARFTPLKQIDKVIQALTVVDRDSRFNFVLLLAGHGTEEYETYLKETGRELLRKKKLRFVGYLNDARMLSLYRASDLFISASVMEGCSVSVIKALACGVPLFSTAVGGTYDIMKGSGAGCFVDVNDYPSWEERLREILSRSKIVRPMDRKEARRLFHWPNIAKEFVDIYQRISKSDVKLYKRKETDG
jgi:glycosyltransferase involved in cell wall biosynthesis